MSLIEGIGDEVTHFFIGLLCAIVVIVAWWTTSITEQRYVQTVWLLDRRRYRAARRLTNHTHAITVSEGTSGAAALPVNDSPGVPRPMPSPTANKPPEEATAGTSNETNPESVEERNDEEGERVNIVETMDNDTCILRQRRLDFYNRNTADNNSNPEPQAASGTETETEPEIEEPANPNIMEHNLAEQTSQSQEQAHSSTPTSASPPNEITIKLKYINDDLKVVNGNLTEQLGDFKKRHFERELLANKLVRLIFNGQVLQQDNKTLQSCGLFDNCVVHCLIHQKRSPSGESTIPQENVRTENIGVSSNATNNNNNQARDWDLGNFLFAIISFTLLSAWYFRYVYAHLYTVTATVGLVLMTGVFSIILFGTYFPDLDTPLNPPLRNHNNNL